MNFSDASVLTPRDIEKQQLRSSASKLGILLLLYNILFFVYVKKAFLYVYYWIVSGEVTFDAARINEYLTNKDNFSSYTAFSMLYSCCVVAVVLILTVITARLMRIKLLGMLRLNDKRGIKSAFLSFPVVLILNNVITTICNYITDFFSKHGTVIPQANFSIDNPTVSAVLLEILYLIIIAPVAEEFIFRGLVLKTIAPYGKKLAIIVSASLFGLMHGNLTQFLGAFACGIIFAAVDVKYNSILPSIIIHMLNNTLPIMLNIGNAIESKAVTAIYFVLFYSILLAGVFVIARHLYSFKIQEDSHELSYPERIRTVVFNIPLLLYTAYLIYDMIFAIVAANS